MVNAFTCTVYGHVQGVGFRYFVKNRADSVNLGGWVRNLSDGTVEILVNGPLADLEQFLHYIKAGPIGSQVDKTEIQWFQTENELKTFEIRG